MATILDEYDHFLYDTWILEAVCWINQYGYVNNRAEEPRGGIGINPRRPVFHRDYGYLYD
jgi:hypothetical protein